MIYLTKSQASALLWLNKSSSPVSLADMPADITLGTLRALCRDQLIFMRVGFTHAGMDALKDALAHIEKRQVRKLRQSIAAERATLVSRKADPEPDDTEQFIRPAPLSRLVGGR